MGYGPVLTKMAQDTGSKKQKKPLTIVFSATLLAWIWCVGRYITFNASLHFFSCLENTQNVLKLSQHEQWLTLRRRAPQQYDCCALFTDLRSQQNKRGENILREVMWSHVSYLGLLYEAARWLWSWRMRRSFLQVKRCPHGPRISSSWWASLAEDEFARKQELDIK